MKLQIENLSFRYNRQSAFLFERFDLTLEGGRILAILGQSGSGKSTLLRIIAGLETGAHGVITLGGTICQSDSIFLPPEQRQVGFVFQDYALFPFLTVADNIRFGMKGKAQWQARSELGQLIELTRLNGLEKRYPHELSGGQQQRAALARSLAANPRVLLLDEPFSNLDAHLVSGMRTELRQILKARDMTAILVTHDEADAGAMADELLRLA